MATLSRDASREKGLIVRKALEQGERSIKRLCDIVNYKPSVLRVLCKQENISLPEDIIPYRFWPELDRLIERSASLCEMCASVGITREGASQYIGSSGQYYRWKKGRKEKRAEEIARREEEKASLAKRVANLYAIAFESATEGGEACKKAAEVYLFMSKTPRPKGRGVFLSMLRNRPSFSELKLGACEGAISDMSKGHNRRYFEDLVTLFENKEKAENKGRATLKELAEGTTLCLSFASVAIRYAEDGSTDGAMGCRPITRHQQECIERAFSLDIPVPDIVYLIGGVRYHMVRYRFDRAKEEGKKRKATRLSDNGFPKGGNYRTASMAYEMADDGCSLQKIARRLGKPPGVVDHAMQHRPEIEPVIIGALREIHPTIEFTRPYRTRG